MADKAALLSGPLSLFLQHTKVPPKRAHSHAYFHGKENALLHVCVRAPPPPLSDRGIKGDSGSRRGAIHTSGVWS